MRKFIFALTIILLLAALWIEYAKAGEANGQAWVICDPESYVNIRIGPGKKRAEVECAFCGDHLFTDSVEKNGYLHVVDMNAEDQEGWINLRYVVFDEPREVMTRLRIVSNARVACRKGVDGKIVRWVKNGDSVYVYWMSDTWAVTNRGYIQSRFIETASEEE